VDTLGKVRNVGAFVGLNCQSVSDTNAAYAPWS